MAAGKKGPQNSEVPGLQHSLATLAIASAIKKKDTTEKVPGTAISNNHHTVPSTEPTLDPGRDSVGKCIRPAGDSGRSMGSQL